MIIKGQISGQELTITAPVIAADTINYLTAEFEFSVNWANYQHYYAHFKKGESAFSVELENGQINESAHVNLSAGKWYIWLHASNGSGEDITKRLTTNAVPITVVPSSGESGEPFPIPEGSEFEQLIAAKHTHDNLEILNRVEIPTVEFYDPVHLKSLYTAKELDSLSKNSLLLYKNTPIISGKYTASKFYFWQIEPTLNALMPFNLSLRYVNSNKNITASYEDVKLTASSQYVLSFLRSERIEVLQGMGLTVDENGYVKFVEQSEE